MTCGHRLIFVSPRLTMINGGRSRLHSGPDQQHHGLRLEYYGIIGMRERAQSAGGRLLTQPQPGGGFTITAELPYE
ncbi:hypothetical protein [Streptomyces sp. NPDC004267]|uniref:hypothetical protein n=1 Tax=Streptomyces sp. NPDC004267 TaxID=3364694 RepID=UPI0036B130C6